MQIEKYLSQYQPVIYKTFINALKSNHLSHAYLLSGASGMPLKETALYLAKSLLCDNPHPLACNSCISCLRVDEGTYADIIVIDGSENKIKKNEVTKIIENFDKTSLEDKGIMIYVIHLVEMMTPVAINSLLKFLEEPGRNIYAFLTTENESKVLPTIISRTQIMRFKSIPREEIIKDATEENVQLEDAQLLSAFYSDGVSIKNMVESENYQLAKQALDDLLDGLLLDKGEAIYAMESHVIPSLKNVELVKLFLKMLALIYEDILNYSINEPLKLTTYSKIIGELAKRVKHIDKSLYIIMSSTQKVDLNVNLGLLLDHVICELIAEE